MKRYWLFETPQYYLSGGMYDWVGDYDTVEEAEDARTVRFNPDIREGTAEKMWKQVQEDGLPPEKFDEVRSMYQRMSRECEGQDTGYHILDTQERVIVQGWKEGAKEKIGVIPLKEFR